MKILYTHRTQGIGAEGAHIQGMYEAFRDLGHDVSMHCLPGCNPSERVQGKEGAPARPNRLRKVYWAVAEVAPQIVFEMFELAYNVPLFIRLLARCAKARPDLIYERYSLNTIAPTWVCRLLGVKHVLEVNDSVVIERSRPLKLKAVSTLLEGACLRGSDLCITITERFRQQLLAKFGLAPSRVMVLTNAVARARFQGPFRRDEVRGRLGLDGAKVLGGTGQFLHWHGLQDLVRQMGPCAREHDIRFLFIGDGPARKDVMEAAESMGVGDRVHFTGMLPIAGVADYLSALDIAVIPKAASHASPMKLIEYMAMGLPIVAPDMPSIRAAIPDGSMGRIFPEGDMAGMKGAVLQWLRSAEDACAAGRAARDYVLQELTWDRHAHHVLSRIPN